VTLETAQPISLPRSTVRLGYIDGLRGVVVLLVLVTHTWVFAGAPALSFHIHGRAIVLPAIPAIGDVGVNLFLVLSGFCLAFPFLRDPTYRDRMMITQLWMRRVRRIVPAYYVSIVFVFLLYPGFGWLLLVASTGISALLLVSTIPRAFLPVGAVADGCINSNRPVDLSYYFGAMPVEHHLGSVSVCVAESRVRPDV